MCPLTAYLYHLDYTRATTLSTSTVGARLHGKHQFNEKQGITANWAGEYAQQSDSGNNPNKADSSSAPGRWSPAVRRCRITPTFS